VPEGSVGPTPTRLKEHGLVEHRDRFWTIADAEHAVASAGMHGVVTADDIDGGNYRRNAARELERFAEWAAGERGDEDWAGIVPADADRDPVFEDLDEWVFREYARHLAGDSRAIQRLGVILRIHLMLF
jgi:hypothetical protein